MAFLCAVAVPIQAQQPDASPQPRAVTRTLYLSNTELFAEWRPFVVGQATRLTAHLTRTGDRFRPYAEGKVTLSLTVEGVTANAVAEGPERPGVFRLNVTPTKAGAGRVVIDVAATTGPQHFVIDDGGLKTVALAFEEGDRANRRTTKKHSRPLPLVFLHSVEHKALKSDVDALDSLWFDGPHS